MVLKDKHQGRVRQHIRDLFDQIVPYVGSTSISQLAGYTKDDHDLIEKVIMDALCSQDNLDSSLLLGKIMKAGKGKFNPNQIQQVIDAVLTVEVAD